MQPITRSLPAVAAFIALCSIAFTQVSLAQVPTQISYQGQLEDGGTPVNDPSATLTFRLFDDAAAGTELWVETQIGIEIADGVFSVDLGSVTSLTPVNFSQPVWLSIAVGDAAATQLSPRVALAAVPYARAMRGMRIEETTDLSHSESVNVIGGSWTNSVAAGVAGGTISGGGSTNGNSNSVSEDFGTVGGGVDNEASGLSAAVGGGQNNTASGLYATIGGGRSNTASASNTTVGGGTSNAVSVQDATIAGGILNKAYGARSSIGGGDSNTTGVNGQSSGAYATVPGGLGNNARADYSFAAGASARVRAEDTGTFVWADSDNGDIASFESTGVDQFLIRAGGGVAIGTNTPLENLRVLDPVASSAIFLGGDGTAGPHGIVFDDDVAGEGVQLFFRTGPNQLVLEKSSAGTEIDGTDAFWYDRDDDHFFFNGNIGVGTDNPQTPLHVVRSISAAASAQNHVALIDNSSTGPGADVLALRVGTSDPTTTNSYVTFIYNGNSAAGFITGNGTGGVQYTSTGSDYAELLPHLNPTMALEPGEVVGVFAGKIDRRTAGADQIMVVSTSPVVVGNHSISEGVETTSRVAFIGQAPVKVRGPVKPGDFLIPSGLNDGSAVAVHPPDIRPDEIARVFGTSWESAEGFGMSLVNAAIGIDQVSAAAEVIASLHAREQERDKLLTSILDRLAAVEARLAN